MKVLHVIDRLNVGGAEKVFVSITEMLVKKGIDTGALIFSSGGALDSKLNEKVRLHKLHRTNKFNPVSLYKAHTICSKYDIVHTHLRHVYAYVRLAQWVFRGGYKVILHDHSTIVPNIPVRLRGIFKPKNYIGVYQEQTSWAVATLAIDRKNVYLLENTISANALIKRTTNIADKAMMVANIRKVKNIPFAIALCQQMGWTLDVYGNVSEKDHYSTLLQQIEHNKNINIIQGIDNFYTLYNQYTLAIHCSHSETGPLVLLEYLAAGIPFIAYKTGSVAQRIEQFFPELFMDNHNTVEWQTRINAILKDKELPEKMKVIFLNYFNPEQYINKCLSIYQNVHS